MSAPTLLISVDDVKHRNAGSGRSPVGVLSVHSDRIEWKDNASPSILIVKLDEIKGQKVSQPNKSKVQMQVIRNNDEQSTFMFVKPNAGREELLKIRDELIEVLQNALVAHRQQAAKMVGEQEKSNDNSEKEKILTENKYLLDLYRHLVSSKLISPNEFWAEYIDNAECVKERNIGVSGAFLNSIAQTDGINGVSLVLNPEVIDSIFKTFPAIERKHYELVPHQMTDQQFWGKFFHSHYFHRDRQANPNPDDPFVDCIRADDADMDKLKTTAFVKKNLDEKFLDEDMGVLQGQDEDRPAEKCNENKQLLVRRCNYQSGRILHTALGDRWSGLSKNSTRTTCALNGVSKESDANLPSSSSSNGVEANCNSVLEDDDIVVDSEVLNVDKDTMNRYLAGVDLDPVAIEKTLPPDESSRIRNLMMRINKPKRENSHLERFKSLMASGNDPFHITRERLMSTRVKSYVPTDLTQANLSELMSIYDSTYELVKHFWICFPPRTAEMEEKLFKMSGTLQKYREESLVPVMKDFGPHNMHGALELVDVALKRYEQFKEKRAKMNG
uniref:BSD domain-containing protein n=1 Tax=Steinernema glaseri TaxID=37863 RepID=A0A1I7ZCS9_9BILA